MLIDSSCSSDLEPRPHGFIPQRKLIPDRGGFTVGTGARNHFLKSAIALLVLSSINQRVVCYLKLSRNVSTVGIDTRAWALFITTLID